MWRFRLSSGQCGDLDYLLDRVEIQIIFGTVWRFRLCLGQCGYLDYCLGQCGDSDYLWDSVGS